MGREGLYLEDHEDQMSLHRPDQDQDLAGSQHHSHYLHKKYKESSRFDRLRSVQHSDDVYQNGSYLGNQNNSNREASRHASCQVS